jgi:hypothetical protein
MSKIRILHRARELIASAKRQYICNAIGHTTNWSKDGIALKRWIQSMLGPKAGALETWMERNHPELWEPATYGERIHMLRATRLAWIDWMISELEKP